MGFPLDQIFGGGLGKLVKEVVGSFKLDPAIKAQLDAEVDRNAHELRLKELEIQGRIEEAHAREIEAASKNIQAEAQSGDPYVIRSRPTFLYVIYAVLIFNFIAIPLIRMINGSTNAVPLDLPTDLYVLFGAGYLGYSSWRSIDKGGFSFGKLKVGGDAKG